MIDVSVIIPVHNVEKYLQQCIDSLMAQTLKTCEFIFVDDASTDTSLEILKRNQEAHPEKIKIIALKENLRQGGARNKGVEIARGKYIGFTDSDDFVAPYMFEELFRKAERTQADAAFIQYASVSEETIYSADLAFDKMKPLIKWDERLRGLEGKEVTDNGAKDLIALPVGGVYCGIYKTSALKNSNITFPEKLRYEDNYWTCLIKPFLKKVCFVEKVGYAYRYNPESTVHQRNQLYQIRDRIVIENKIIEDAKQQGFFDRYHEAYEWGYIFRYAVNSFKLYIGTNDNPDLSLIRRINHQLKEMFPGWVRNPYYRSETDRKEKLIYLMIINAPTVASKLLQLKRKRLNIR